jgi:ribosomal protein S18 acetylase RimI-like enzyme
MVGFVMYGIDADDDNYWIYRLMIDARHQRKGYGRAAMTELLRRLQESGERAGKNANKKRSFEQETMQRSARLRIFARFCFRGVVVTTLGA